MGELGLVGATAADSHPAALAGGHRRTVGQGHGGVAAVPADHQGTRLGSVLEAAGQQSGELLAQACTGCHNAEFTGGPIAGGPPDWAPSANLTPKGLAGWKYEDFEKVLREGKKPDGAGVKLPMTLAVNATKLMKEQDVKALWAYFQSLPPKERAE